MGGFSDRFERRVIPRWHESQATSLAKEARTLQQVEIKPPTGGDTLQVELERTRTVGVAADALNVAVVVGNEGMAQQAAAILLEHAETLPVPLVSMAKQALGMPPEELEPISVGQLHAK